MASIGGLNGDKGDSAMEVEEAATSGANAASKDDHEVAGEGGEINDDEAMEEEEEEEEEVDDDEEDNGDEEEDAHGSGSGSRAQRQQQKQSTLSYPIEDYVHPSTRSVHDLKVSFAWNTMLGEKDFVAAPVQAFKHAPMSVVWDHIIIGMKVEVENKDSEVNQYPGVYSKSYWIASILRISGYYVLLRYEGFGQDGSKDFWMNITSEKVHPVGWCITKGKPLIPPKSIVSKYADWREFLVKRLTGARTLPINFYAKLWSTIRSQFRPGMKLEVVDKMRICQVKVATIKHITGKRLYLEYDDFDTDDNGFWCHEASPLIHPVGWARRVGHQIEASKDYHRRCEEDRPEEIDCTADMFPEYVQPPGTFSAGMKIEAVDPLNLASVCVATVMQVLRFGYIMIRIDGYETDETGSDWFCYHASSPLIFPPGFSEKNRIKLKPPSGWEDSFKWVEYFKETKSIPASVSLFHPRDEVKHGFKVGMKLEASDQMDPRLICVSTIARTVGRLLKVHFDGWEDDYDQWMDCETVDIYPVGWGELVGHKLEGPRQTPPQKKEKRKLVGRKGKKRSSNGQQTTPPSKNGSAATSTATSSATVTTIPTATVAPSSSRATTPPVTPRKQRKSPNSPLPPTLLPETSRTPPPPVLEPQTPIDSSEASDEKVVSAPAAASAAVKVIPRLVDSTGATPLSRNVGGRDGGLDPSTWDAEDVSSFLGINECATLVDSFKEQKVDGSRFLSLTKPDIMKLVNNKMGPCLKVENLMNLLKARMNPAQARFLANIRKPQN